MGGKGGKGGKRGVGGKRGNGGKRGVGNKRGKGGKRGVGGKHGTDGKRGVGGKGQHPRTAKAMADSAAMLTLADVADGGAVVDGAHASAGGHAAVDCSTDPEILRQFRPRGSYYAHAEPVEVVDGVPRVTDNCLYDMCVRNRARAHTRRVHAQYEALPDFIDVMAQAGLPDRAGDRVAEVHGDPYIGNQCPQRRVQEVMSFCNEVVRYQVPLHPFHRLVDANALLFPVKWTETVEAAANSFCRLLRNRPKAAFLKRTLAEDLSVLSGHDSGLEPYLEQLALVKHEENDDVEDDRSPRVTGLPNPFRLPIFSSDHRRAADTRFFRGRESMPTAWAAGFLRASRTLDLSRWLPPIPAWKLHTGLWVATPVVVSYLADALRNAYSSVWQEVYSEYYCNLVAAWVHTLQKDKFFVHLDDRTLRHFDVLYTSELKDAPDGEAKYVLYGKMRQAMKAFSWPEVLKDVVWRDRDFGEAYQVRITVDATKEYGFCLRHPCVDFDWALDTNAPLPMAVITSNHPGVWRCGRRNWAHDVGDAREGRYRPRSPRRDRSPSPPRAMDATWPTSASSSAAVTLFGSARARDVRARAPCEAALSAVANAWVEQIAGLRTAVERADGRGVELALSIIGQALARAVDGDANYGRFAQHLEVIQPGEEATSARFNAQSILGRRTHEGGGPSMKAPPSARNTCARSVSQESAASVGARRDSRRDSRRGDEEEE